jgi:hypothetical protein
MSMGQLTDSYPLGLTVSVTVTVVVVTDPGSVPLTVVVTSTVVVAIDGGTDGVIVTYAVTVVGVAFITVVVTVEVTVVVNHESSPPALATGRLRRRGTNEAHRSFMVSKSHHPRGLLLSRIPRRRWRSLVNGSW